MVPLLTKDQAETRATGDSPLIFARHPHQCVRVAGNHTGGKPAARQRNNADANRSGAAGFGACHSQR